MEKSRSWPSAHDWKSCIPQKGIEGSNPSFSAIALTSFEVRVFYSYFSLGESRMTGCSPGGIVILVDPRSVPIYLAEPG